MAERYYLPRFGAGAEALVEANMADVLADAIYDARGLITDGRVQLARQTLDEVVAMLSARDAHG